jgi:hypothetical protein
MTPLMGSGKPGADRQALFKQWVEHIQDHGVNLTPREEEFIESVAGQIEEGRYMSEAQGDWIEEIYTKRTP